MKFSFYLSSKNIYTLITNLIIFILIIFLFTNSNIIVTSIKDSVDLFIYKLIPSLYIYIFITELLINFNVADNLAFGIDKLFSRLFKIPKHSSSCVIIGFLLGYPNSAKYILKLFNEHKITTATATKLAAFTSNANPAYILGTIGISMFRDINIGIVLLVSHFISAMIIGLLYNPRSSEIIIQQTNLNSNTFKEIYSPFEILYKSIFGALKTLAMIFSYTVIFSLLPIIITSKLHFTNVSSGIITGIFEISNGINLISNANINFNMQITIISFILSFSSLMVIMQIYSFIKKANVKLHLLVKYKFIQGIISSVITYILMQYITPVTDTVFSNVYDNKYLHIQSSTIYIACIFFTLTIILLLLHKKSDKNKSCRLKKGDSH